MSAVEGKLEVANLGAIQRDVAFIKARFMVDPDAE